MHGQQEGMSEHLLDDHKHVLWIWNKNQSLLNRHCRIITLMDGDKNDFLYLSFPCRQINNFQIGPVVKQLKISGAASHGFHDVWWVNPSLTPQTFNYSASMIFIACQKTQLMSYCTVSDVIQKVFFRSFGIKNWNWKLRVLGP